MHLFELAHWVQFPSHPRIKNFGFVQPNEIEKYFKETGIFILPSHYEHWGVVIHEFAAGGFPLLCTNTTGATSAFLKDGVNGFTIKPKNVESLVDAFKKVASLKPKQLLAMSDESANIASTITPQHWINTVVNYIES